VAKKKVEGDGPKRTKAGRNKQYLPEGDPKRTHDGPKFGTQSRIRRSNEFHHETLHPEDWTGARKARYEDEHGPGSFQKLLKGTRDREKREEQIHHEAFEVEKNNVRRDNQSRMNSARES
jgi:hypothetical protein